MTLTNGVSYGIDFAWICKT